MVRWGGGVKEGPFCQKKRGVFLTWPIVKRGPKMCAIGRRGRGDVHPPRGGRGTPVVGQDAAGQRDAPDRPRLQSIGSHPQPVAKAGANEAVAP